MVKESTPVESPNRIGNMNGPWGILLKVMLATYPFIIAWASWVTVETIITKEFRQEEFVMESDGKLLKSELESKVIKEMSDHEKLVEAKIALINLQLQAFTPAKWESLLREIKETTDKSQQSAIENNLILRQTQKELTELKTNTQAELQQLKIQVDRLRGLQ